jgi:hypothetical protein
MQHSLTKRIRFNQKLLARKLQKGNTLRHPRNSRPSYCLTSCSLVKALVCQPSVQGSIPGMSPSESASYNKGKPNHAAATHHVFVYSCDSYSNILCIVFYAMYSFQCSLCIVFIHCVLCIVFLSMYSTNCFLCISVM